jgi:hypothetical protein
MLAQGERATREGRPFFIEKLQDEGFEGMGKRNLTSRGLLTCLAVTSIMCLRKTNLIVIVCIYEK